MVTQETTCIYYYTCTCNQIFFMHFQFLGRQLTRPTWEPETSTQQLHYHLTFLVSYQIQHRRSLCIQLHCVATALDTMEQTSYTMWWQMEYVMSTFSTCMHTLKMLSTPTLIICGFQCLLTAWSTLTCHRHFRVPIATLLSVSTDTDKIYS